ncbi:MAG: Chemotaxis signal transduction protein [Herminiimonas sp.]|nr:Chemotaxis signal transduction protein [Herminiimonas sp.]
MLFLLFQLDADRYALDARQVAEVLPLVALKALPRMPPWVAGTFSYHGKPVPVIDLTSLALGRPSHRRLGTRMVLMHYPEPGTHSHLLGIIVEKATNTVRRDEADFAACGIDSENARYLGPVANDARGLIQWVRIKDLLPAPVRAMLFPVPLEA